jgi:hypothetical protein
MGSFLLPWCVLLAAILPTTARAQNWSLAWVGLDGAEAVAALATAALLSRADTRAALTAAAAGTLLLIDAWFDVCTSAPGAEHALALAEAAFIEAPLAIAAWWLALTLLRRSR